MKNLKIFCLFSVMLPLCLFSQGQEQKNIVGFGIGYVPSREAYVDAPPYIWLKINASPVFEVFYSRQFQEGRLGSYAEFQSATLTAADANVSRYNIGLNWISQYPKTSLQVELGGYFGYGFLKADGWDQSLYGTDYGIIVGPAYEKDNFGIALHAQFGFGYYTSSGVPDEVDFSMPRYILKVYYKF